MKSQHTTFMLWVILCVSLIGCQTNTTRYSVSSVNKPALDIESPKIPVLRDVEFLVLTTGSPAKNNMVCLSADGYKNLTQNTQSMLNHIIVQRSIINEYKKYYEPEDSQR